MFGGSCDCEGGCEHSDIGPWNDGSIPGFPKKEYERLNIVFDTGVGAKAFK